MGSLFLLLKISKIPKMPKIVDFSLFEYPPHQTLFNFSKSQMGIFMPSFWTPYKNFKYEFYCITVFLAISLCIYLLHICNIFSFISFSK
jgi:hypothetical protein